MKLATLRNGQRDGQLVVVSSDLHWCTPADAVAATLQLALDNWSICEPQLQELASGLINESVPLQRFREREALSPLPRAYQWLDASAYVNHVELVRRARGVEMPDSFWTDPLMYQGGSDTFLAPRDPIRLPSGAWADEAWGIDMEAEIAVILNDVPMAASDEEIERSICLVMLVNDVSLRGLIPAELSKGFGFLQGKPSTAFSPVAVTPDELGEAWDGRKLNLPLKVDLNQKPFGRAVAAQDMTFDFPQLIRHATKSRALGSGTILGSGTVSNKSADGTGHAIENGGVGYSCIAELRTIETIELGAAKTPFMQDGDQVRIEITDGHGASVFGAIEQTVETFGSE